MDDNRTYIRLIFDKILKDNVILTFCSKFVKFYYTIFSHPLKTLKFEENMPLNRKNAVPFRHRLRVINSKTNILG